MTSVVVQISRGVAPAACIVGAVQAAARYGARYFLVAGLPAADAKNAAVQIACDYRASLVLVEDDMIATPPIWERALLGDPPHVMVAGAPCRNGEYNIWTDKRGRIVYAGSVFLRIPRTVIEALSHKPLFEPWVFRPEPGLPHPDHVTPVAPCRQGTGSDVYFWWRLRAELPAVEAIHIGDVRHFKHALNSGPHNLAAPIQLEEFQRR